MLPRSCPTWLPLATLLHRCYTLTLSPISAVGVRNADLWGWVVSPGVPVLEVSRGTAGLEHAGSHGPPRLHRKARADSPGPSDSFLASLTAVGTQHSRAQALLLSYFLIHFFLFLPTSFPPFLSLLKRQAPQQLPHTLPPPQPTQSGKGCRLSGRSHRISI